MSIDEASAALQRVAVAVRAKIEQTEKDQDSGHGLQGHYSAKRLEALREVEKLLRDEVYQLLLKSGNPIWSKLNVASTR